MINKKLSTYSLIIFLALLPFANVYAQETVAAKAEAAFKATVQAKDATSAAYKAVAVAEIEPSKKTAATAAAKMKEAYRVAKKVLKISKAAYDAAVKASVAFEVAKVEFDQQTASTAAKAEYDAIVKVAKGNVAAAKAAYDSAYDATVKAREAAKAASVAAKAAAKIAKVKTRKQTASTAAAKVKEAYKAIVKTEAVHKVAMQMAFAYQVSIAEYLETETVASKDDFQPTEEEKKAFKATYDAVMITKEKAEAAYDKAITIEEKVKAKKNMGEKGKAEKQAKEVYYEAVKATYIAARKAETAYDVAQLKPQVAKTMEVGEAITEVAIAAKAAHNSAAKVEEKALAVFIKASSAVVKVQEVYGKLNTKKETELTPLEWKIGSPYGVQNWSINQSDISGAGGGSNDTANDRSYVGIDASMGIYGDFKAYITCEKFTGKPRFSDTTKPPRSAESFPALTTIIQGAENPEGPDGLGKGCSRAYKYALRFGGMGEIMHGKTLLPYGAMLANWIDPFYDAGANSYTSIMGNIGGTTSNANRAALFYEYGHKGSGNLENTKSYGALSFNRRQGDIYQISYPAIDPRVPAIDPRVPAIDPRVPVIDPKEPVIDPKEPVIDPKEDEASFQFRFALTGTNTSKATINDPNQEQTRDERIWSTGISYQKPMGNNQVWAAATYERHLDISASAGIGGAQCSKSDDSGMRISGGGSYDWGNKHKSQMGIMYERLKYNADGCVVDTKPKVDGIQPGKVTPIWSNVGRDAWMISFTHAFPKTNFENFPKIITDKIDFGGLDVRASYMRAGKYDCGGSGSDANNNKACHDIENNSRARAWNVGLFYTIKYKRSDPEKKAATKKSNISGLIVSPFDIKWFNNTEVRLVYSRIRNDRSARYNFGVNPVGNIAPGQDIGVWSIGIRQRFK